MEAFGADRALDACAEYRVTALVGVPAMYQAFAAQPEERLTEALASVRLLTSGAAPLAPAVLAAIKQATGLSVFEGYGLTETGPVLTSTLVGGVRRSPARSAARCPASSCGWSTATAARSASRRTRTSRRGSTRTTPRPAGSPPAGRTCSAATGPTARTAPTRTAGSAPATSATSTPTATCGWSTGPTT